MARTTGYTCSAVARAVAEGRFRRPGISPPETIGMEPGCWQFVLDRLAERGVVFQQSRTAL